MLNKKTLSLKVNKSFVATDAPFTPIDQTLRTPMDPPNQMSYFPQPPPPTLYSNPLYSESDDILTDVDEPNTKAMRNYSVSFTPLFDTLVMNIYSHIVSLPTTTPFLGTVPPSGLASRVANETFHNLIKNTASDASAMYDTHSLLSHDHLKNHAYQPIFLQLIRKRLIDLCSVHRPSSVPLPQITSVQVPVPSGPGVSSGSQPPNGSFSASHGASNSIGSIGSMGSFNANAPNCVYNGLGMRQLSISNLLLNEQNVSNYNQQLAQAAQMVALSNSRLRLSSLNLRKQSLTRNNSYSGTNWLHVGNVQNIRSNGLGMNPEFGASSESLQLMNDYVPQAFIRLGALLASLTLAGGNWNQSIPVTGFNSMMLDYQTPPTSGKSSILLGSTPSSAGANRDANSFNAQAASDCEEFTQMLMRSRSSSRGNVGSLFPKPLTINTDASSFALSMQNGAALGDTLNSPFVSATIPTEDVGFFGPSSLGNVLPGLTGLRSGPLIPESPGKDVPMANGNNKINLPGQFSLSEKKRDSLKLKRGIH